MNANADAAVNADVHVNTGASVEVGPRDVTISNLLHRVVLQEWGCFSFFRAFHVLSPWAARVPNLVQVLLSLSALLFACSLFCLCFASGSCCVRICVCFSLLRFCFCFCFACFCSEKCQPNPNLVLLLLLLLPLLLCLCLLTWAARLRNPVQVLLSVLRCGVVFACVF